SLHSFPTRRSSDLVTIVPNEFSRMNDLISSISVTLKYLGIYIAIHLLNIIYIFLPYKLCLRLSKCYTIYTLFLHIYLLRFLSTYHSSTPLQYLTQQIYSLTHINDPLKQWTTD